MAFLRIALIVFFVPLAVSGQSRSPKNIVLMIGDGMGLSQVTAGRTQKGSLELEKFKNVGLLLTHAYGKDYVTDSAAGATALSTGVTTYNGAIAVGPDTSQLETVLEKAQAKGKKTGIVVVCSITHATPAAFMSHTFSRNEQLEIAKQVSNAKVDVLLGSGWGWFLPKEQGGRRTDGLDLLQVMRSQGYVYVSNPADFRSMPKGTKRMLGLFAENHVPEAQKRDPSLQDMTAQALGMLSTSENGFFLMVEGSQIDWAGHDNKSDQVMLEMADFDNAIGEVVQFARNNPETLVIVTADHETGGYSLTGGTLSEKRVEGKFTTGDHTAVMVPLFAMGPGADRFAGIQPNSAVGKILMEFLGR